METVQLLLVKRSQHLFPEPPEIVGDIKSYCIIMDHGADYSDVLRNTLGRIDYSQNAMLLIKFRATFGWAIEQYAVPLDEIDLVIAF